MAAISKFGKQLLVLSMLSVVTKKLECFFHSLTLQWYKIMLDELFAPLLTKTKNPATPPELNNPDYQ